MPAEDLLEAHAHLEAGQRGAEAHVNAVTETDVLHRPRAIDVELVGPVPHPFVAVGRAEQQQHLRALGHVLAVQLDRSRVSVRAITCVDPS